MPKTKPNPVPATKILGLKDLTREIQRAQGFGEILASLKNGKSATVDGAWGSASALAAGGPRLRMLQDARHRDRPRGDVDDFRDDVATFAGIVPEIFPAWENPPRELERSTRSSGGERAQLRLLSGSPAAPGRRTVQATLQPVPNRELLARIVRTVAVGRWCRSKN